MRSRICIDALRRTFALFALATLLAGVLPSQAVASPQATFASLRFEHLWNSADKPVAERRVSRSWTWGPLPWFSTNEPYKQSPEGQRLVQYFDKARMELNNPSDMSGPLQGVTNGLLVVEMVWGRVKLGDGIGADENEQRQPAFELPVAGDWAGRQPSGTCRDERRRHRRL
ncbi:MAG: hypothetical protein AVDCRST_MAG93-906 [uncultured Chloroflexia bacterium]|uniref:Alginate export domain-containing protein n=1 Tax=uncultured Chloroflexia bacterium TaxID=1672391 RepID=A0A6J4HTN0_9CHLR|nr:MAG: hypothetical protein AVDCRST_MAG93-906 [uncultured Chloroflexia bacterium]